MAYISWIEALINAAQEAIGWDMAFNVKRAKQSLLSARHHAANLPLAEDLILPQARQEIYFFNKIGQKRRLNIAPAMTALADTINATLCHTTFRKSYIQTS
ncbi:hypothetical protein ABNM01_10810 [Pseudomonas syringae]|uniref:hypothetical protein n=1 Tax=Pseudomonas syringae group TaxID=136849 RepID=UPI0004000AB9|nr:Unknown protein sequence [Pseudomonas coronafaciens pv. oryzae]